MAWSLLCNEGVDGAWLPLMVVEHRTEGEKGLVEAALGLELD